MASKLLLDTVDGYGADTQKSFVVSVPVWEAGDRDKDKGHPAEQCFLVFSGVELPLMEAPVGK